MPAREQSRMLDLLTGSSGVEALGGLAAIVLAVLGLVGVAPSYMLTIAAIVIGGTLLINGLAVATEYSRLAGGETRAAIAEIGGGVTMEVLCGITAVVLGVLSLLGIAPAVLMPIAAIVIGAGLALSASLPARIADLRFDAATTGLEAARPQGALGNGRFGSGGLGSGTQLMIGLGTIVLGILALVGVVPAILTLVAFLTSAVALLMTGFASGAAMVGPMGR